MNKLRHKHGIIAKEKQAENEENKSWRERNSKQISQEEHQERLNKLKEIGLLK